MELSTLNAGFIKKTIRSLLIIGSICAVITVCAYRLYWYKPTEQTGNLSATYHSAITQSESTSHATMEIIYEDEVTRTAPSKARLLFMELQAHPNFQKALENPQARANIDRMLEHPEIEKKLNSWYAIAIRKVIHSRVNEPNFPELIANPQYVDNLFKEYGIV